MRFDIKVKEVWIQQYEVEAKSREEAIKKINNQEVEPDGCFDYDYTLPEDEWDVEEIFEG